MTKIRVSGRPKRSTGPLIRDHSGEFEEKFISVNEAASILEVSPATVKYYMDTGRLPTELSMHTGTRMILRDAVMAYGQSFYPESKRPYATCKECGKVFERKMFTSGRAKDPSQKRYRDGDLCPECRKAAKNGGVVEQRAVSTYEPHINQVPIHESKARYKIINAGARFGKDRSCINEFIRQFAAMLSEDRGPELIPKVHGFLVAPNFPLSRQLWREVKEFFPKEWIEQIYEGDKVIKTKASPYKDGSDAYGLIEVKSADDPNALVSVGLDIVQLTEAARIPNLEEAWAYLGGRVNSPGRGPGGKGGIILANSTPRGKGFWYKLTRMGKNGDDLYDSAYETFHYTTYDNPYVDPAEIDRLKKLLPERLFRQEYLAEFLDQADSVFINVDECASLAGEYEVEPGEQYIVAWDPAQSVDFSTVGVRNSRGETVEIHRWTGVPWASQIDRVKNLSIKYNFAPVRMDATGLGRTLPEALDRAGVQVEPIMFNNSNKEDMVNHLAFLMEQKLIAYPKHEALIQELKDFRYTVSERGVVRYAAPRGSHDDLVTMMILLYKDYNSEDAQIPFFGILGGVSLSGRSVLQ